MGVRAPLVPIVEDRVKEATALMLNEWEADSSDVLLCVPRDRVAVMARDQVTSMVVELSSEVLDNDMVYDVVALPTDSVTS